MTIRVSNTGKTITVILPAGAGWVEGARIKIEYRDRKVTLIADPAGHKINDVSRAAAFDPTKYPSWPTHGLVELTDPEYVAPQTWTYRLPDTLPDPKPQKRHKQLKGKRTRRPQEVQPEPQLDPKLQPAPAPEPVVAAEKPDSNVVLTINEKAYAFCVPPTELIDTVLGWVSSGYSVK